MWVYEVLYTKYIYIKFYTNIHTGPFIPALSDIEKTN